MRIYSPAQDHKMFLSPYVQVLISEDNQLLFRQRLFDTEFCMPADPETANDLLTQLNQGIDDQLLCDYLTQMTGNAEESRKCIILMQQAGVLE